MTVTNTQPVKSFNRFLAYMVEAESHNGIDERFVMSRTRGPISLGSARRDFTRLMAGKEREVEAIATLHSSAPGECEMIAAILETEHGLDAGSLDKHDPEVIERYLDMVVESEDRSAPGTAGIYAAQVDGESGLLHVHGMRINVMLRDVEVPVTRREYELEDDDKTILRDAQGRRVPKRDDEGKIVYEQTVEVAKAGAALPPSMRDSLRARRVVDEVWLQHGIDNAKIVSPRPRRGAPRQKGHTYEDRARAYLDALEARRETGMSIEDIITAIKSDGHEAELRGKKRPVLTLDFIEDGAHHRIRTQRLSTPERDYSLQALAQRMSTEPATEAPVAVVAAPAVEVEEGTLIAEVASDFDAYLANSRRRNAALLASRRAASRRHRAEMEARLHAPRTSPAPIAAPSGVVATDGHQGTNTQVDESEPAIVEQAQEVITPSEEMTERTTVEEPVMTVEEVAARKEQVQRIMAWRQGISDELDELDSDLALAAEPVELARTSLSLEKVNGNVEADEEDHLLIEVFNETQDHRDDVMAELETYTDLMAAETVDRDALLDLVENHGEKMRAKALRRYEARLPSAFDIEHGLQTREPAHPDAMPRLRDMAVATSGSGSHRPLAVNQRAKRQAEQAAHETHPDIN